VLILRISIISSYGEKKLGFLLLEYGDESNSRLLFLATLLIPVHLRSYELPYLDTHFRTMPTPSKLIIENWHVPNLSLDPANTHILEISVHRTNAKGRK
jgi:hypothetical protein